jgi:hypothetical protein
MAKWTLPGTAGIAAIVWLTSGANDAAGQQVQGVTRGWQYAETHAYDETVRRALALLPRRPRQVVVIDTEKTARALQQRLERTEAFVMVGEPIVCLRMQGSVLKNAQRSGGMFDYALATIIWHEMAHIDGADERRAQEQEEDLWRQFILGRRVNTSRALAYLARLTQRRGGNQLGKVSTQYAMETAR